ncbi:MAG: Flp pilus assembly complex ATPase component TadA [Clostridia bacterium]|nr:Flp pilus assembly complex ATPase component TadA [Clostridia bacterium]
MTGKFDEAVRSLSPDICSILLRLPPLIKLRTFEVRLRCNQPLMITADFGNVFISKYGQAEKQFGDTTYICSKYDLEECFKSVCQYSVHSYQNEINQGFVTVKGGHRVGLCGSAVCENEKIINVKNISSINLRIAASHQGAAADIVSIADKGNTVIVGPPLSGKTTLLRDIAYSLSLRTRKVCVVDERGEICAPYNGQTGFDMGYSCDCMYGYKKAEGISIAIRTLSPDVIVFDEIGTSDELSAVADSFNAGVRIVTSVHSASVNDFVHRKMGQLLINSEAFDYFVFLKNGVKPGKVERVLTRSEIKGESYRNITA